MQSIEDFVDAGIATLIRDLPGALTAIETLYEGGPQDIGTLPRPRPTDYFAGGGPEPIRYPMIEVAIPDLGGQDFSIDQHESDAVAVMMIRAWLQHPKYNTLYRICCRYGAAIHNVVCDPDPDTDRGCGFGPEVTIQRYQAAWRFNPSTNERDEVTSAVMLTYWLDAPDIRP